MIKKFSRPVFYVITAGFVLGLVGCETFDHNRSAGLPIITYQPEDHSVTNGETNVQLQVNAEGNSLEFQWFKLEPSTACTNESLTVEQCVPGATNNILAFDPVSNSAFGLYFCQILNHPRPDKPPFGLVRETRSRLASLSGSAGTASMGIQPPVEGNVRAGSAGKNDCLVNSFAYVTFPDSGTGYPPQPSTDSSCTVSLSNAAGAIISPNLYRIAWLANQPQNGKYGSCISTNQSGQYYFTFTPKTGLCFMFTVYFVTKIPPPPAAGSQVYLTLSWQPPAAL
jgi:hypothetical protein